MTIWNIIRELQNSHPRESTPWSLSKKAVRNVLVQSDREILHIFSELFSCLDENEINLPESGVTALVNGGEVECSGEMEILIM